MDAGAEFFARVRPLLGKGLEGKHVHVDHGDLALPLLEMLHACMLDGVTVEEETLQAPWGFVGTDWRTHLQGKNPWKGVTSPATVPDAYVLTQLGDRARIQMVARVHQVQLTLPRGDVFTAMDVFTHAAFLLRDVLTGQAAWRDEDIQLGAGRWPFALAPAPSVEAVETRADLHIMVVGCGSLGSEAIRLLQPQAARWTLVDAGKVTVFNLNRQWFSDDDLHQPKVDALQRKLHAPVHAVRHALDSREDMDALLATHKPDVVLLATGTHHHAALAESLWHHHIPHVAVCCYPQARFFEVVMVDANRGTPCFECLRGHLYRGKAAPAPMTDEVAGFVYSTPDDGQRGARYQDLVAEPATRMDTFRAANVAARAVTALVAPHAPQWLQRAVEEGTTCLLGANTPVRDDVGEWAYGLAVRGQVVRLGLPDLAGAAERETCGGCGRDLQMRHVEEVAPPVLEEDQAMMEAAGIR